MKRSELKELIRKELMEVGVPFPNDELMGLSNGKPVCTPPFKTPPKDDLHRFINKIQRKHQKWGNTPEKQLAKAIKTLKQSKLSAEDREDAVGILTAMQCSDIYKKVKREADKLLRDANNGVLKSDIAHIKPYPKGTPSPLDEESLAQIAREVIEKSVG